MTPAAIKLRAEAAALEPPAKAEPVNQAISYWARTIGAARSGDAEGAGRSAQQFEAQVEAVRKSKNAYLAEGMEIARDEVRAWLAFAEKKDKAALRLMRDAADRQDARGKEEVDIPAREMLADMLLELNRPQEALAEYEKSLQTDPNRFNGLYGAARAAELAQQGDKAAAYYAKLLKNCDNGAHSDRPELSRAKLVLARK